MAEVSILKNTRRQAVVSAVGTGTFYCNLQSLLSTVYSNATTQTTQTFDEANAQCTITDIIYSVAGGKPTITRNGLTVFNIGGTDGDLRFSQEYGFVLNGNANANITINFNSAEGSIILGLTKGEGFIDPDLQLLQQYERP